jgi:hypothetical protein
MLGLLLTAALLVPWMLPLAAAQPVEDPRFFEETGVRIDDDRFWEYFRRRGGTRTFGFPVSHAFTLLGSQVQLFQRHVLQLRSDGSVGVLSLFGRNDLFPYTRINGSTIPGPDPAYLAAAPSDADVEAALTFVSLRVPDVWMGQPVRFLETYLGTVRIEELAADGLLDAGSLPALALELWGLPTSAPSHDPNNPDFVFLRFQNGVMQYDVRTDETQALLLADYFKAILTGEPLPPDLWEAAVSSRFYRQYDPSAPLGVARPADLPDTNLREAFPASVLQRIASMPPAPTPIRPLGPATCLGDEQMHFSPAVPVVGNDILILVTSAASHQHVRLTSPLNPTFVREREGHRGRVWEWTTRASFRGQVEFTFHVDSTVVCAANSVTVLPHPGTPDAAPASTRTPTTNSRVVAPTATPEPTARRAPEDRSERAPTATPVPTSTPAPTATPIPSATPQTVSPSRSTVSRTPAQQSAQKGATVTITVTLLDAAGLPVPNKLVRITSDRPTADSFQPGPDQWTNKQGQVIYTVSSCSPGPVSVVSTYTVEDRSDGITLDERPTVTWTVGSVC